MNNSVEQFEEVYSLICEVGANYAPASGAIAATNDPPRKDFGPASGNGYPPSMNKKGLLDPYQSHPDASMSDPDRPPHLPFPLETVNDYLGDSYVYLDTALKQMSAVVRNNPSLDPVFKAEIKKMTVQGKHALKCITDIGKKLTSVANLNY